MMLRHYPRLIGTLSTLAAAVLLQGAAFGSTAGAAPLQTPPKPSAIAKVSEAAYCFARVRGLRPERLPPSYLVLRMRLRMTYQNAGSRALIVPLAHERKVYMSLLPGTMTPLKEQPNVLAGLGSAVTVMKHLPADVNPDNPVDPINDVFTVVPAGGQVTLHDIEEVELPIYRRSSLRKIPDLRGKRVYLRLSMAHQELDPVLDAVLSDRWVKIGTPWTGNVLSNTLTIDVPANATGLACIDKRDTPLISRPPDDALRR